MTFRRSLALPTLLLAALSSLACGGSDDSGGGNPTAGGAGSGGSSATGGSGAQPSGAGATTGNGIVGIESFEADEAVVEFGASAKLTWTIKGEPDELLLDGVDVLGESDATVKPRRRQRFELRARFGAETFVDTVEVAARGIDLLAGSERGAGNADGTLSSARFHGPATVEYDGLGNLYIGDYTECTVRKIDTDGNVTTLAGNPLACDGVDGKGSEGHFRTVAGIAADDDGTVYVADAQSAAIRRIAPDGTVSTLAGKLGEKGAVDGKGADARFRFPNALTLLPNGDLLVIDSQAYAIRRVTPEGDVTTEYGVLDQAGTANSPEQPLFKYPTALARGPSGELYVADGCVLRKISPQGEVSLFAGDATHACGQRYTSALQSEFDYIYSVAVGNDGTVYFQDTGTYQVLRVVNGDVEVFAGRESTYEDWPQDGTAATSVVGMVWDIAVDPEGDLVLAERYLERLRKVDAAGSVHTFAGQATPVGDTDGPIGTSRLGMVNDLLLTEAGDVLVLDGSHHSLRAIDPAGVSRTLAGGNGRGWYDAPAPDALFDQPTGVVSGPDDNYFVLDVSGLRELSNELVVSTVAGTPGASEPADGPPGEGALAGGGKAVRVGDALYMVDAWGDMVRRIDADGTITTIAGKGYGDYADGEGTDAAFEDPMSIGLLPDGDLVVADASNYVLRRVTLDGEVTTLAGVPGEPGYDDGPLGEGKLGWVYDLAVAPNGDIFLVDDTWSLVRKLTPDGTLSTVAGQLGRTGVELGKLPGSLLEPTAIEVTPAGDLLVGTGAAVVQITAP